MGSLRKKTSYQFGLCAEAFAAFFLRLKGFEIIAKRYRNYSGEIDIIAVRHKTIIFVEVKARKNPENILETIVPRQQRRIIRAAELFLSQHPHFSSYIVRFDAILICPFKWPIHIQDGWRG